MKANKIILLAGLIILTSCNSTTSSLNSGTTSVDVNNSNVNLSISLNKNELYFDDMRHPACSSEQFVFAPFCKLYQ